MNSNDKKSIIIVKLYKK